ncbi:hypothetical protein ARMSODRAFT_1088952 [Armillaria solidipes]|uniref:DNA (cytosine-5-)-methyltransferase n=1 Tax=Armillaria solidipes TaxID=1076256 RepID=A0A2H3BEE0_9AGAR|nr:hypothetical protein ARMSODRAFT_1088952 [Armillaria solidipes]
MMLRQHKSSHSARSSSGSGRAKQVARRRAKEPEDESDSQTSDSDDSAEEDINSGDDYTEDGPNPPKLRKGLDGLSVGSSGSTVRHATLPKAGPWHPNYVLSEGGVAEMENRKGLNISPEYGKDNFWPRSAGLRELIQNMFDGALVALRAKPSCGASTAKNIEVRHTFPSTGNWRFPIQLDRVPNGQKLTFELHYKPGGSSKRGRETESTPLGWVSFKPSHHGKCQLELYNAGEPLDFGCMSFGFSSKAGESHFIGQHGDGMKMGINAIIRPEGMTHPPKVFYVTGKKQWEFLYVDNLLEAHQTVTKKPNVPGVLTQVFGFPLKSVKFDDFLFLRPAVDTLEASEIKFRGRTEHVGTILLDERLRHHIFVKGVFVQKRAERKHGLYYGVDVWQNVRMSRDRVGLQDDAECSNTAFNIWRLLFEDSERARQLYIDLLIKHDSCLETRYIVQQLEEDEALLLFNQLQKDKGDDVFFYHAEDAGESVRIIEQVLRKRPFPIPREFYQALLQCNVIVTPEAARTKRFRNLASSAYYNGNSPQLKYTAHLIEAFLDLDPDMTHLRGCFHFKSASADIGVEIVVDGGKVLLHELTLSSVFVHRKPQFAMCYRHLLASQSLEGGGENTGSGDQSGEDTMEDGQELAASLAETKHFWPNDASASVCDCSVLYVLHLMTQELTNVTTMRKTEIEMGRQFALRSLPRNLTFEAIKPTHDVENDAPLEMTLSWSTDDNLSGFRVFIRPDVKKHAKPLRINTELGHASNLRPEGAEADGDMQAINAPARPVRSRAVAFDLLSDSDKIVLNDRISNGKKYVAQVCWNKVGTLFSLPLSFAVPPSSPSSASLKIECEAQKMNIEWDTSPESGADSWIVVLKWNAREILRREVAAPKMEALLEEELGDDHPLVAEDVRRAPPPPPSPITPSDYGSSSLQRRILSPAIEPFSPSEHICSSQAPTPRPNHSLPSTASTSVPTSYQDTPEHLDPIDTRDFSPGLEYVDRFDDFESVNDDGPARSDRQVNYGYDELPVDDQANFAIESIQDKVVAKPTPMDIDDSEYVPVKSTFIDHQKFAVNNYYMVQLQSCDGSVHDSIIYVHSIRYPQDPADEASNIAVLQLSQYIDWSLVHPDAPDNELLLLFSEAELMGTTRDSETFSANAIVKVRERVQVSHRLDSDATSTTRHFICNWSLRRAESCKPGTIETFVRVPEQLHALEPLLKKSAPPLRIGSLTFGDIFCGAGGASCGFKEAGFTPKFGVEASCVAGGAFEKNCIPAALSNESFDTFLGHPWPENSPQAAVISVCPPSGIFTVDKHPVIQVVDTFKPAYVVYNCSMDQLSTSNIGDLRKLQYQILKLGYSFTYGVLKATDFGVSTIRNRLVLIAAAPAQHMPELPSPTHGGTGQPSTPTLQDAISDLDWKNPTCKSGLQSAVDHPANCLQPVSRHCTGCSITDFTSWDDSRTVADWNEPLPALLTVPSEKWKCRHPNNPQRFLTVREMARALSFPDSWDFSGSLKDQYSQVANALPPLLAKAIAEEIRTVIVKFNPHLVSSLE